MTVSVQGQALSLTAGLLLGMAVGVCYDLLRILRCRIPLRALGITLDLLFWAGTTLLLFLYAQLAEGGRVRIYLTLALFLGGTLYFHLFSRSVLRLGYRAADLLVQILWFLMRPLRSLWRFLKKNGKIAKNIFSSRLQWFKMFYVYRAVCRYHHRSPRPKGGQEDGQNQKGRYPDKDRHPRPSGLSRHRFAQSERADRRRRS